MLRHRMEGLPDRSRFPCARLSCFVLHSPQKDTERAHIPFTPNPDVCGAFVLFGSCEVACGLRAYLHKDHRSLDLGRVSLSQIGKRNGIQRDMVGCTLDSAHTED